MARFDSKKKSKYVLVTRLFKELRESAGNVDVYYRMQNSKAIPHDKVDLVLDKMLDEFDNQDLVVFKKSKTKQNCYDSLSARYGGPVNSCITFNFYLLREDIPKIETDEPIHVLCVADEFPDDKEEFLEVLSMFV